MGSKTKSKSVELIDGLSKRELFSFNRFIRYYLRETNRDVLDYWSDIYSRKINALPEYSAAKIYPRKVLSDFNKIITHYYFLKSIQYDKLSQMAAVMKEVRKRNLDKLFNKMLKESKQLIYNMPTETLSIAAVMKIQLEEYFLYNTDSNTKMMNDISSKMRDSSEKLHWQIKLFDYLNKKIYNGIADNKLENEIPVILIKIREEEAFYKKFHRNIYLLYKLCIVSVNMQEQALNDVKKEILKYRYKLTPEFFQFCYMMLFRLVLLRINTGTANAQTFAYSILKDFCKNNIWRDASHVQPLHFLAAVNIALNNIDDKLVDYFMNEISRKVSGLMRNDVMRVCNSMICLHKKHYSEAISHIKDLKPKNPSIYLFARTTLMKAMYEKNDIRYIYSLIDSVKHYIHRRSDMSNLQKESVYKFLWYLNQLALAKRKEKVMPEWYQARLMDEKEFFGKKWIVEKCNKK